MKATHLTLDRVQETLLLPLWGRAEMTRAGSPILMDHAAVELIDALDYDFANIRADLDYSKNLSWIARARQFDEKIRSFLHQHPDGTIINLGAGLDTTFGRVDNGRMHWIDLDVPEVIELRQRLIPETPRSRCIATSVHDADWMNQIGPSENGVMFVAGGLLFYFTEREVMHLLRAIGRRFHGAEIVFDAMTPAGIRRANDMLQRVGMRDAVLQWGLADATIIESWDAGLKLIEQFEYFRGLKLGPIPFKTRIMVLANRFLRVMTIVHCRYSA
jgi:O-methyltransferase involved in polyketide biosynthesis